MGCEMLRYCINVGIEQRQREMVKCQKLLKAMRDRK